MRMRTSSVSWNKVEVVIDPKAVLERVEIGAILGWQGLGFLAEKCLFR